MVLVSVSPKLLAQVPVPARLEAEAFVASSDLSVAPTSDASGGGEVGWIPDGGWLTFDIAAGAGGLFRFDFRVANGFSDEAKIVLKNSEGFIFAEMPVPRTGGMIHWKTVPILARLPAGDQTLTIFVEKGVVSLNWLDVLRSSKAIPGKIQAEAFDQAGDIATEYTSDEGGGLNVGWIDQGDWLDYAVSVSQAATYEVDFRVANQYGDGKILIKNESGATIGEVADIPRTGGWQSWTTVSTTLNLSAGDQIIRIYAERGDFNLNWLEFAESQNEPTDPVVVAPALPLDPARRIPLDPARWYLLNSSNANSSMAGLFDGETQQNVQLGYGMALNSYEAYYPLQEGESMSLEQIRMFDFEGIFTDNPARLAVVTADWQRVPVATFTGSVYNGWVGPYPDRPTEGDAKFSLDSAVNNIRYLVLTIQGGLPTELELYGDYQAGTPAVVTPTVRPVRLRDMLGVNGYEWNFFDPNLPNVVDEPKMQLAKSFAGLRHYMDWEKLESSEGVYSYSPTLSGGWHYDKMYERCKAEGIEVLACLKTVPNWLLASYPASERDHENVPMRFGRAFDDPASYIEQARVAFQYTARYGSNTQVDPALLSVHAQPRWTDDVPNQVRIGTDLIRYIECDNERDKWWKGRKGYQTAREYAANMSAFYDGHKNSMGAGIGVKNADPNMQVVIAGLVSGAEYIRGMVDWCREFRGYKPNGEVDLCWDIINYHVYSDDASSSQSGTSSRGVAPELADAGARADAFVRISDELCYGLPVWITETGYDIHQDSPLKAIPIGQKSALDTQADWILRTSLLSARRGIQKVYFYQMYDDNTSGMMFASSGLLDENGTRRPAADFLRQTNTLFGHYAYAGTLHQDPIVDKYTADGKTMYALVVPDEVGRTVTYDLAVGDAGSARVYRPVAGRDTMAWADVQATNGLVRIEVGETPLFVVPGDATNARLGAAESTAEPDALLEVVVYPNPITDRYLQFKVKSEGEGALQVKLFSASQGTLHRQQTLPAGNSRAVHRMDLANLPAGEYLIEVRQNVRRAFKKIVFLP